MRSLVAFHGRAGDRNDRAMAGAVRFGSALSALLGLRLVRVGTPAPALAVDWRPELEAAKAQLLALQLAVTEALSQGPSLAVLNRCAASLATLPAVMRARPDSCVVWFDAHADSNTPEQTTTGYLGGMVLTGAAGRWTTGLGAGLALGNVVLVGSRDLDPCERHFVDSGTIKLVEPGADLGGRLMTAVAGRPVYVHLDCDVLDAGLLSSEFQVSEGLSFADLRDAFAVLAKHEIVGLEIAEFEATWPDGRRGDLEPLVEAIAPVLGVWRDRHAQWQDHDLRSAS